MKISQEIKPNISDVSKKSKKLVRSKSPPVYADELTEIKLNANNARLTFGIVSPNDDEDSTNVLVNESVTVVLPITNFLACIQHMLIPISKNNQLLEVISKEYQEFIKYAESELDKTKE